MSVATLTRIVAVAVLLVCCAAAAFAAGRALRHTHRTAAITPFRPPTVKLHAPYSLGQLPGLPPLSRQ